MIEFPLDFPEVRVLKTELKRREIVITVESTRHCVICSRCGQKTFELNSYDDSIRLKPLPVLEQRVCARSGSASRLATIIRRRNSAIGTSRACRTSKPLINRCCGR
jgi:hypothetical protein